MLSRRALILTLVCCVPAAANEQKEAVNPNKPKEPAIVPEPEVLCERIRELTLLEVQEAKRRLKQLKTRLPPK